MDFGCTAGSLDCEGGFAYRDDRGRFSSSITEGGAEVGCSTARPGSTSEPQPARVASNETYDSLLWLLEAWDAATEESDEMEDELASGCSASVKGIAVTST
jgi:hypothetical protein